MSEQAERIVVIDDDHAIRLSCTKILAKVGFPVEAFEDGTKGLAGVARLKPGLVLVDLKMPGLSGIEVIGRIHEVDPQIIVIVITGYATIDTAVEAMKSGAYDFLPKPFSPEELRLIVNRGLERRRLALESRRYEMERELVKRRFVTFVSHQLQAPLAAVHQYLDVLRHLGDTPEAATRRQEWIERCLKRTEELQALVRDWLTLAKVEGGLFTHERVKVDVKQIIAGILRSYEEMAAADRVSLEARLPENGCFVPGDRDCLSVLFDNLITNAIKYNKPEGKVTVSVEPAGDETVISVSDTGAGIPEKDLPSLFGEFFRAGNPATRRTPGTGLGLSICKKIVSEMGGDIGVESRLDVGTTFRVRLPAWNDGGEQHDGNSA